MKEDVESISDSRVRVFVLLLMFAHVHNTLYHYETSLDSQAN